MSESIITGLDRDPLYSNREEFLSMADTMKSLHKDEDKTDLRNLLQLVRIIMDPPKEEAPNLEKLQKITFSNSHLTESIRCYTNSIRKQLVGDNESKEKEILEKRTMTILERNTDIPLTTQGILALVAFATAYGKFRLLKQQMTQGSSPLAKSIALLKQQHADIQEINKWSNLVGEIFKHTLDLADQILDTELCQISKNKNNTILHFTAIYRILMTVVLCYSQVETVLIKPDSNMIATYTWASRQIDITKLEDKRKEIKRLLSAHQPSPTDEARRSSPQRSASWSFYDCWMKSGSLKLGSLINTTSTIKSRKQIKSFTRTNSLPDTHLMFSEDVQGALLNKEPAYKEAM